MFLPDLVIRSRRVVVGRTVRPAAVHIRGKKIVGVLDFDVVPSGCPVDEAGDAVVMSGLVDTHVHLTPSGDEAWTGFEAATRAAAAGGVTTLVDMPFPGPATTTVGALDLKRRAAEGKCFVDVAFWGGVVPGNARDLTALFSEGVCGFKCVLARSRVENFPVVTEPDLHVAAPVLRQLGAPLLAHAELQAVLDAAARAAASKESWLARLTGHWQSSRVYDTYLGSRPREAENEAVSLLIRLCHQYGTAVHVVHLSSSDALAALFQARAARLPLTAETCPHYLFFPADEVPRGDTSFKCEPPIRERENRERLWAGLTGGVIQMVVSDHWPPPADRARRRDFFAAPGGIWSLQLTLPAMWAAASTRQQSLGQLSEWMCRSPARLAGLHRKGALEVGYDADLVIWRPETEFMVESAHLQPGLSAIPYRGKALRGIVERTYLRGTLAYERGKPFPRARGELLCRDAR